jgi:hypothetical protein
MKTMLIYEKKVTTSDGQQFHHYKHKHILLTNLGPSRGIQFTYKEKISKFIGNIQYTF